MSFRGHVLLIRAWHACLQCNLIPDIKLNVIREVAEIVIKQFFIVFLWLDDLIDSMRLWMHSISII